MKRLLVLLLLSTSVLLIATACDEDGCTDTECPPAPWEGQCEYNCTPDNPVPSQSPITLPEFSF